MNEDMPWIDLTPEEIQELRTKKQELTEYGKQKIRELMNDGKLRFYDKGKETLTIDDSSWGKVQTPEIKLEVKEMTHEEMLEEAARREKALEALDKLYDENGEGMKQLAETERPFYRFFAVEYFATGEGMSFWLKACRNYESFDGRDREMESFKEFIGCSHYYPGIEEPTEEEFRTQYAKLIPAYVSEMLDRRDQPGFIWETHYHFNYS